MVTNALSQDITCQKVWKATLFGLFCPGFKIEIFFCMRFVMLTTLKYEGKNNASVIL